MPEIGTSGSMSGDGKRSAGLRLQATAPILDSTKLTVHKKSALRLLVRPEILRPDGGGLASCATRDASAASTQCPLPRLRLPSPTPRDRPGI